MRPELFGGLSLSQRALLAFGWLEVFEPIAVAGIQRKQIGHVRDALTALKVTALTGDTVALRKVYRRMRPYYLISEDFGERFATGNDSERYSEYAGATACALVALTLEADLELVETFIYEVFDDEEPERLLLESLDGAFLSLEPARIEALVSATRAERGVSEESLIRVSACSVAVAAHIEELLTGGLAAEWKAQRPKRPRLNSDLAWRSVYAVIWKSPLAVEEMGSLFQDRFSVQFYHGRESWQWNNSFRKVSVVRGFTKGDGSTVEEQTWSDEAWELPVFMSLQPTDLLVFEVAIFGVNMRLPPRRQDWPPESEWPLDEFSRVAMAEGTYGRCPPSMLRKS
jgi:hypothetical protein